MPMQELIEFFVKSQIDVNSITELWMDGLNRDVD